MNRPCFYCCNTKYEEDWNIYQCKKCGIKYSDELVKDISIFKWMYITIFRVFWIRGKSIDFENNRYIPELFFFSINIFGKNIVVWKWLYLLINKIRTGYK